MVSQFKKYIKIVFVLVFCFFTINTFAQQYQINNVEYDITGRTLKYPLKQEVDIDFDTIFEDKESLDAYVEYLTIQFNNIRVLDSASIVTSFKEPVNNIVLVDLLVSTKDSMNFIIFPMPKYSSSEGFSLKLDSKDYNFLGTMTTLDAEIQYELDLKDKDDPDSENEHSFNFYTAYSYPFSLGEINSSWRNSLSLGYTIGDSTPNANFDTGLSFGYKISDFVSLNFGLSQGFVYDQDYEKYGDEFYFEEGASFSVPFTLAKTSNVGNLTWTPNISTTYYWDLDGINSNNADLYKPSLSFGHSFSLGSVDWIGNFKDGLSFSFSQSITQRFYYNAFTTHTDFQIKYFKAFEYVGIKSRIKLFQIENDTQSVDDYLRGVHGSDVDSDSSLLMNFDLPIKVWQTDWVGYGFWDWMRFVDFEMQLCPFIDAVIGYNSESESTYSIKDGLYAAGIEIVGFPSKYRSVQGRISLGVDVVNFADKVGNKIGAVDKIVHKLFNTSWRGDNWYELSIGIGLFY